MRKHHCRPLTSGAEKRMLNMGGLINLSKSLEISVPDTDCYECGAENRSRVLQVEPCAGGKGRVLAVRFSCPKCDSVVEQTFRIVMTAAGNDVTLEVMSPEGEFFAPERNDEPDVALQESEQALKPVH